nr:XK-related protein 8 [Zonotrichia albicollis]
MLSFLHLHGVAAVVCGLGRGKEGFGHKSVGLWSCQEFVVLSGVCCPVRGSLSCQEFVALSGVRCPVRSSVSCQGSVGTKVCSAWPLTPAAPHRCLYALKVGWRVCWARAEEEDEQRHIAFISHDISMLRLFETFLENTPQLTLLLYIVLRTNKAEISQGLGMVTAFLCVSWSLLDYHQSLRSFLQDKYELSRSSSIVYFLWNLFLICPRILALALFALLWPYGMAVHFSLLWLAMFLWVSLQGTDFMESPGSEQLYRAMVAVILYFSWFNVAQGRTLHRSIIYHGFMLVDSTLLGLAWLWGRPPEEEEEHSYLIPVVSAALPCYLLGLGLRVTYYKWLHPNVRVRQEGRYDEVDANGGGDGVEFRSFLEPDLVNRRMQWLAQSHFSLSQPAQQHFLNGDAAVESAV